MLDRYTRWPEAVPMPDMTADTVARVFYSTWIARFGCPHRITTDQGRQFESSLMTSLTNLLGIKRCRTTPYRPQSNGMVERWHRDLKAAIMCHEREDWCNLLPTVLLGFRTALKEELLASPAELVYGTQLRIPGEFLFPTKVPHDPTGFAEQLCEYMRQVRPVPVRHHTDQRPFVHPDLQKCSHVFLRDDAVRRPLQQPYTGPHKVVDRSKKTIVLNVNGKMRTVNIDRVKPAFLPKEPELEPQPQVSHEARRSTRPKVRFASTSGSH